jgi:hypothetical protein
VGLCSHVPSHLSAGGGRGFLLRTQMPAGSVDNLPGSCSLPANQSKRHARCFLLFVVSKRWKNSRGASDFMSSRAHSKRLRSKSKPVGSLSPKIPFHYCHWALASGLSWETLPRLTLIITPEGPTVAPCLQRQARNHVRSLQTARASTALQDGDISSKVSATAIATAICV